MAGRFGDLKLNLQRGELAYAETFVALGNGLAFAYVTPHYDSRKWRVDAGLVGFEFQALDFGVAAFDQGFVAAEIVLGGLFLKFGGFEIGVAG